MALDRSKDAGDHVEEAARKARSWMDRVTRDGYVAKGLVYATVGILAGRAALGVDGKTTGAGGAVESIGSQPLGRALLVLLAAGLLGYALWKLVQGIMDPDDKGSSFGHTTPQFTFPIGGRGSLSTAGGAVRFEIEDH